MNAASLLDVRGLTTRFHLEEGIVHAVEDVSFTVAAGQRVGIAGESGSGKTVTALSVMGLIDPPGRVHGGEVWFKGEDLRTLGEGRYRQIRGSQVAMIFQDPLSSLNPVMRIGDQMIETIRTHRDVPKPIARRLALELLTEVGMPDAPQRLRMYPHELSGGMRQRVGIAIALSCEPDLIIADEPTTALDVTLQAQFLELLKKLTHERNTAVILITHDLGVIANFAQEMTVMYAGRIVERGDCKSVFHRPQHPYTRGLLDSVSRLDRPRSKILHTIPGLPPNLLDVPAGCSFHPRCGLCKGRRRCWEERPRLRPAADNPGQIAACHFADMLDDVVG